MKLATISIYEQLRDTKQPVYQSRTYPFSHTLTSLKLTSRQPRTDSRFCNSYNTHHESKCFFVDGLSGRCPSMNDRQPRANAGQNYPVESRYHPTARVGIGKTLVINELCMTRHTRIVPQERVISGVACECVNALGPRHGHSTKPLSLFHPLNL